MFVCHPISPLPPSLCRVVSALCSTHVQTVSWVVVAWQVLTCSLFRLVSLFYVMSFYSISKGYADKKEPSKRQTATTNGGGGGGEKHD